MKPAGVVEAVDVLDEVTLDIVHVVPAGVALKLERERREELSATALSQQSPLRLMLHAMPLPSRSARYSLHA